MLDSDRAVRIQEIDQQLSKFWNKDWKDDQKSFQTQAENSGVKPVYDKTLLNTPETRAEVEKLLQERQILVERLSAKLQLQEWFGIGPWFDSKFLPARTSHEEALEVRDLEAFDLKSPPKQPFPIEHRFYSSYTLRLDNLLSSPSKDSPFDDEKKSKNYLKARLECDADMIYDVAFLFFARKKTSSVYEFNWYYNEENGQRLRVQFTPRVTHCQLKFYDPHVSTTWTHGMELADLTVVSHEWRNLTNQVDICARPVGNFPDSTASFFWQQDFNFDTCPQTFDKMVNLSDSYNSINQRILSLTGAPLRRKDFDDKNPMAPLDFSRAPSFDVIWVSSLNFSADFYGMVLSRALRYHAENGTQIRVLTAEVSMKEKDKAILEALKSGVPNVKVQYFKYRLSDGRDGTWLDRFHRVSHTKLLIGYSATNTKASFLVTGGRNIRDSYLFKEAPGYKAYASLKSYGDGEEPFIFYQDFEIEIQGHAFVKSVLAQMLSFWMRDAANQGFRSTNINIPKMANEDEVGKLKVLQSHQPLIRHLVSLPYYDGYQLEKFYVNLIDSARSEILITTPYFRPSVAISAAFDRAAKRGVKTQIMTRIQLAGDGVPQIAEDVNKKGINLLLKDVDIFEWTATDSILHAKLFVVDRKLSFVSSVNLNRRSFLHDVESGALILDEKIALELRGEILNFIRQGKKITQQERISWFNGTLIDWADSYF
jgi:phosphatidylserine/phosphatidylglycerophosphate/cardiolipin synthase-like enzyme